VVTLLLNAVKSSFSPCLERFLQYEQRRDSWRLYVGGEKDISASSRTFTIHVDVKFGGLGDANALKVCLVDAFVYKSLQWAKINAEGNVLAAFLCFFVMNGWGLGCEC
jgi:hypothetical protein